MTTRKFDQYFGEPFDQGMPATHSYDKEFHKVTAEDESKIILHRIWIHAPGEYSLLVKKNDRESEINTFQVGGKIVFLTDVPTGEDMYVVIRKRAYTRCWRKKGIFGKITESDGGYFNKFVSVHLEVHLHSVKEIESGEWFDPGCMATDSYVSPTRGVTKSIA